MPLSEEAMVKIEALLGSDEADARAFAALRSELNGLSLTRCDLSDLGVEQPFRQYPRFSLFLVDASDHCWRITDDPTHATGLVVAEKPAERKVEA